MQYLSKVHNLYITETIHKTSIYNTQYTVFLTKTKPTTAYTSVPARWGGKPAREGGLVMDSLPFPTPSAVYHEAYTSNHNAATSRDLSISFSLARILAHSPVPCGCNVGSSSFRSNVHYISLKF